jgi:hypothetical protein
LSREPRAVALLAEADELAASGRCLEGIERLRSAILEQPDPYVERRLAMLRFEAFEELEAWSQYDQWPVPVADLDRSGPACIPEISRDDLDPDVVRRNILEHGSVRVSGLLDAATVAEFGDGIELALSIREQGPDYELRHGEAWFQTLPVPPREAKWLARHWVAGSGGLLTCDSPRLLFKLFEAYQAVGLREVLTGYLGERPVLGANKCTLRRVPLTANTDWHQDGAFLGPGIRALNIWVALSDCGDDSPGIDLLPRRFDSVVETGSGGAIFDWAVGPAVVEQLAVDAPVVRPLFSAGDALLFDDLFLHRTGIDSTMVRPRYAIESWFFGRSSYPDGQVPLVW